MWLIDAETEPSCANCGTTFRIVPRTSLDPGRRHPITSFLNTVPLLHGQLVPCRIERGLSFRPPEWRSSSFVTILFPSASSRVFPTSVRRLICKLYSGIGPQHDHADLISSLWQSDSFFPIGLGKRALAGNFTPVRTFDNTPRPSGTLSRGEFKVHAAEVPSREEVPEGRGVLGASATLLSNALTARSIPAASNVGPTGMFSMADLTPPVRFEEVTKLTARPEVLCKSPGVLSRSWKIPLNSDRHRSAIAPGATHDATPGLTMKTRPTRTHKRCISAYFPGFCK